MILIKNITQVFLFFQVWLEQSQSRLKRTLTRWWHCGTDRRTSCWAAPTTPLTLTCGQYCSIIVVNCSTTAKWLCDQLIKPVLPKQQMFNWILDMRPVCLSGCLHAGVLVVSSTRWRQVGLCFLVPQWRRSFTSYSNCWVRTNQLQLFLFIENCVLSVSDVCDVYFVCRYTNREKLAWDQF